MTIYLASTTRHAEKWRRLRETGVEINSSWIDEAGPSMSPDYSSLATRCLAEIGAADALILYVEAGDIPKGALIEVGAALALGKSVIYVGPDSAVSRVFREHPLWSSAATFIEAVEEAAAQCASYR